MRLTKTHREAFVRAALDDVPQIDYYQQVSDLVQDYLKSICPKEVLKVYENPKTQGYFGTKNLYVYKYTVRNFYLVPNDDYELPSEIRDKVSSLCSLSDVQYAQHIELRDKLRAAIAAFTTRKAAADALPEFEKYLPADESPINKSVPMVANLVADLTAAGWPKDKKSTKGKK